MEEEETNRKSVNWIVESNFMNERTGFMRWEKDFIENTPPQNYGEMLEGYATGSLTAVYKN